MVSSRLGLVESSATGAPISSSSRRTYLIALGRQFRPGARASGRFRPALHRLVDRLDAGLRSLRGRQVVDPLAVEPVADADLQLVGSPSSTSSLVSAMPLMPPTVRVWRTSTASNQPQRRGRPVTVPNSRPRSPRSCPVSSLQFGRERPLADARRVGLGDAEHVVDGARAEAGAGRRLRRHGVGRGDERIGAVVDVEQRALRAFEQDALALAPLAVEQRARPCRHKAAPSARSPASSRSSASAEISGRPSPRRSGLWWVRRRSIFGLERSAGRRDPCTRMARRPTLSS